MSLTGLVVMTHIQQTTLVIFKGSVYTPEEEVIGSLLQCSMRSVVREGFQIPQDTPS